MNIVVEGESDAEAAKRVVTAAGHPVGKVSIKRGKLNLDKALANYARAAQREPWAVFRDSDGVCPVELRRRLLTRVPPDRLLFALRIAHSMTEAWLMADSEGFAGYFGISRATVPPDPEALPHAKHTLLGLCLKSRKRAIQVEVARSAEAPGPLFVHHLNTFAAHHWNIDKAAQVSPSLRRAIATLAQIPQGVAP